MAMSDIYNGRLSSKDQDVVIFVVKDDRARWEGIRNTPQPNQFILRGLIENGK